MSVRHCVQCNAITKKGIRCKRITCKYTTYCWQHTQLIRKFSVKKSTIPGAGNGLFTLKNIKKGDRIIEYTGEIIDNDKDDNELSIYGIGISNDKIIDAKSTQSELGRYSNDCRKESRRKKQCKNNNARFEDDGNDRVYLVATKRIRIGEEIFTDYGNEYWQE